MRNDIITVVRDPAHDLGKCFAADGTKTAAVSISVGIAKQYHVPTLQAMAALLGKVSDDRHAAIINASFPAIPVGQEFLILSEKELSKRSAKTGREALVGVHQVKEGRTTYSAVGRFKENVKPSSWQLLDRDIDQFTPPEIADLNYEAWLQRLNLLLPGVSSAGRVEMMSSSARVTRNGKPLSAGNGHTWVQVEDAEDVGRARVAVRFWALKCGLSWRKPKFKREDPSSVVGYGTALVLDESVWTPGRLVFNGKPTAAPPLKVKPQVFKVVEGHRLNTSRLATPSRIEATRIAKDAGLALQLRSNSDLALSTLEFNLTLNTELELEDGSVQTVEGALATLATGCKLRCQAPFRSSQSMAAFLARGKGGKPFVHDVGTGTTHWLCDQEAARMGYALSCEDGPDVDEVKAELERLTDIDLNSSWAELASHLSEAGRVTIIEYVRARTKQSVRVLNAHLKEAVNRHNARVQLTGLGQRKPILLQPENSIIQAVEVERLIIGQSRNWDYVSFGGVLSSLKNSIMPGARDAGITTVAPSMPLMEPINPVEMRARVEAVAVFQTQAKGGLNSIAVPNQIVANLLGKSEHAAQKVNGLLLHPIVLRDGGVLTEPGLDVPTGLLMVGEGLRRVQGYNERQARQALQRLRSTFLEDFQFQDALDEFAAISALITGIERRLLDQAPGYAILAPVQSSGKTTLVRRLHVVLTSFDLSVNTFPEGDSAEARKMLLATLLRSPAMVCYDNITDGITFESGPLAAAMTSPTLTDRILGETRSVTAPTNVLFTVTGNNLALGSDEVTRWIPIHLNPVTATPQQRSFRYPDVVSHARQIRDEVLRDALGIVAGYLKSPQAIAPASRFPFWDRMVRQPIMWAGGADIASAFAANVQRSPSSAAGVALLTSLRKKFGTGEFTASSVADLFKHGAFAPMQNDEADLYEALGALKSKDPSKATSVGRALRSMINRHVSTSIGQLTLKERLLDGSHRYWVA